MLTFDPFPPLSVPPLKWGTRESGATTWEPLIGRQGENKEKSEPHNFGFLPCFLPCIHTKFTNKFVSSFPPSFSINGDTKMLRPPPPPITRHVLHGG